MLERTQLKLSLLPLLQYLLLLKKQVTVLLKKQPFVGSRNYNNRTASHTLAAYIVFPTSLAYNFFGSQPGQLMGEGLGGLLYRTPSWRETLYNVVTTYLPGCVCARACGPNFSVASPAHSHIKILSKCGETMPKIIFLQVSSLLQTHSGQANLSVNIVPLSKDPKTRHTP